MIRHALRHPLRLLRELLGGRRDIALLKAEYAAIAAFSEDAIISKQLDGTVVSWNLSAERLFGYTAAEAIGRPVTFLMPPDRRNEERDIISRLVRGERIEHYETVRRHKDGRDLHVSLSISPIKDEDGRVVGAAKIVRDITAQREANRVQREHAAIIAFSEDAIISKRLDGTIRSWNSGAERLFGYTAAEAIGRPVTFLMPPDRRNEERDIISRLVRGERIEHYETVRRHKDGRDLHVSLSISPIKDEDGTVVGAAKIARDITARKYMEQALKLSEERHKAIAQKNEALYRDAQEANRLKDEFLATLSHELRTPLNAIYGWVHMARAKVLDEEGMDNALETIDRNARMLCKLIDELLDVSRIVTGKLQLDCHRIDLTEVVREAVAVIRPTVSNKGIKLEVSADAPAVPFWGDGPRLQQALWNLLSNAAKFTPAGGSIRVRTARVGTDVHITVSDTGEGIDPSFLPFVFDRFRQADSSSSRKYGGLGLGLSLVRFISELHGGTVEAQSAGIGQGASFTIMLPINVRLADRTADDLDDAALALRQAAFDHQSLLNRHVLVVEDEGDAQRMLTALLESHGATVTAVGNAGEALAKLHECKPDVVLSDIGLPGEDGYALIEQIRSFPETDRRNVRVIAVTAHARPADRTKALSAGYDEHIAKPFDPEALLKAVSAAYL